MKSLALASVAFASSLGIACGGQAFTATMVDPQDAGEKDSGSAEDGAADSAWDGSRDGGKSSSCSLAAPAEGQACTRSGLECEYGNDVSPRCNTLATCDTSLRWHVSYPPKSGCPTPDAGIGSNCPKTYGEVQKNHSCAPSGTQCSYPEGRCACTSFGPVLLDGGTGSWYCEQPQAGCPYPRPRIGSECSVPSTTTCDYGGCFLPGGTVLHCTGGVWQEELRACPASAG